MLALLFVATIGMEILIVAYTIAVVERRRIVGPTLSAILEAIRLISVLIIIDSQYRLIGIAVATVACAIGNYLGIRFVDRKTSRERDNWLYLHRKKITVQK